ncbi:MAG: glycosyltransferase family 39 protein [Planctomycetes bacterium]|nr:glycosyltransferase family 39 protein [Planctomycetota bacterium]
MPRSLLWFALLCHVVFATGYAWCTPSFEGPDENSHYEYAWQMGNAGRQPLAGALVRARNLPQIEGAEIAIHPPLYYALLGRVLALTGTDDTVFGPMLNPDFGNPDKPSRNLKYLHGSGQGEGVLFGLRLLSVLFGAITVVLVHRLGRATCPAQPRVADLAALLVATLPMFSFLHGLVHNDTLAIPLATGTTLLLVRVLQHDAPTWRHGVGLGALIGVGLLTKLTALFLLPLVAAAFAAAWWRGSGERRRAIVRTTALTLLVAGGISAPMFLRNLELYGDVLAMAAHDATFPPIPPELRWDVFRDGFLPNVFRSVFGTFGWFALHPHPLLVACGVGVATLALFGLWRAGRDRRPEALPRPLWLLALAMGLVFAATAQFNWKAPQPQARFLFPAIGPAAVVLATGLLRLVARLPQRRWLLVLPPLTAAVVFVAWFLPAFRPGLAPAPPWQRALVGDIVRRPDAPVITWQAPLPTHWRLPLTLRWSDPGAPAGARYTLYVHDDAGRVLLATHEWTHGGMLLQNGEATLPDGLLPFLIGDELTFVLRRVPATPDEVPATLPTSPPLRLRRP